MIGLLVLLFLILLFLWTPGATVKKVLARLKKHINLPV
jgi:hypothetical protein